MKNKKILIKGFKINCPLAVSLGMKIFEEEFGSFIDKDFNINVYIKKYFMAEFNPLVLFSFLTH